MEQRTKDNDRLATMTWNKVATRFCGATQLYENRFWTYG